MTGPCRDCTERHPHCHSFCAKYIEFREKLDRVNQEKWEQKEKTYLHNNYISSAIEKMKKNRRR